MTEKPYFLNPEKDAYFIKKEDYLEKQQFYKTDIKLDS